jgi:hypothetical protein
MILEMWMNGLNIKDDSVKARWWLLYQQVVKQSLDTQRSNCNMAVKAVVIGKHRLDASFGRIGVTNVLFSLVSEAIRLNRMPSLVDILGGRRMAMQRGGLMNGVGKSPFFFFCNSVLECVAGKKEWKQEKNKLVITGSCVTVTDEAFALLLLVNSWEKFTYLANHRDHDGKIDMPETMFTEKKGRNRKLQGWTEPGIEKFNELCMFVIEDRASDAGKRFEEEFLAFQVEKTMQEKNKLLGLEVDGENEGEEVCEPPEKKIKFAFNHLEDLAGIGLAEV